MLMKRRWGGFMTPLPAKALPEKKAFSQRESAAPPKAGFFAAPMSATAVQRREHGPFVSKAQVCSSQWLPSCS
jgi:hypothetical protein